MTAGDGSPVATLRNIGPKSAAEIEAAGFATAEAVLAAGPAVVFAVVRGRRPAVSRNLLWSLEGAAAGIDWREVSPARKAELLREVDG